MNETELKMLFDSWAGRVDPSYARQQWLLSKWEVVEGVIWPPEKVRAMIDHIASGLECRRSDLLLDLGCGGGWILKELATRVRWAAGLDFSPPMLTLARSCDPAGHFIAGEIGRLPLRDGVCDRALSYFVFLNFMEDGFVQRALQEVHRILKKGGRALIGQLPDMSRSRDYDRAKSEYLDYCQQVFHLGKSNREVCRAPQKLFDREHLETFLRREDIPFHFRDSFNPFLRPGSAETVPWRFDLILEK